jgi:hypothetical protein
MAINRATSAPNLSSARGAAFKVVLHRETCEAESAVLFAPENAPPEHADQLGESMQTFSDCITELRLQLNKTAGTVWNGGGEPQRRRRRARQSEAIAALHPILLHA